MKQNKMDLVTDLVKKRIKLAFGEAKEQFKNTNPYRQEPISTEEQLYHYSQMTPELEFTMRQSIGDDMVNDYKMRMEKLKRRYK